MNPSPKNNHTDNRRTGRRPVTARLDKILADAGVGSRKVVRQIVLAGRVTVDGQVVLDPGLRVFVEESYVELDGQAVRTGEITLMLNKPAGVITATHDHSHTTVIDLVDLSVAKKLIPVGRLDKDTEGLMILTTDGQLCHQVISPRKGIEKEYIAEVTGVLPPDLSERFANGVHLRDGTVTKPAQYRYLSPGTHEGSARVSLTITEGKYHQVKRMFAACGLHVVRLQRIRIGSLTLDENLAPGEYRELTRDEIQRLLTNPRV